MPSLLPDSEIYDLQCQLQACQSRSRRNGKVARLSADLRAKINSMIDEGLLYKDIIKSLGPAGRHLNEDNISNWRLGGYQDYLKAQALTDRARLEIVSAATVVSKISDLDSRTLEAACKQIALLHYLKTLINHGEQLTLESITRNPLKIITLMNACCNAAHARLASRKENPPSLDPNAS
jgi:hypothetical protein